MLSRALQGMNLDPALMGMMKGMDSTDVNAQLESLGLSPSEVINKIMAEPDLAAAFQKPKVMQVRAPVLCPAPSLVSTLHVPSSNARLQCTLAGGEVGAHQPPAIGCTRRFSEKGTVVGQAIMESQSNPMAIMNYQDDPDVMLVRPHDC